MEAATNHLVNWSEYSKTYNLLLQFNPAYQAVVGDFKKFLTTLPPPKKVLDIGAGTGNYSLALLEKYPDCTVDLVELDAGMAAIAKDKTKQYPNANVFIGNIDDHDWSSYDLVVAVHALYVMPNYEEVISKISESLSGSNGRAYICDIGRVIDVPDWRKYIAKSIYRTHGLSKTISILWKGRRIAKENISISEKQRSGEYWSHSKDEFLSVLRRNGLDVVDYSPMYRDCSDRVLAKRLEQ